MLYTYIWRMAYLTWHPWLRGESAAFVPVHPVRISPSTTIHTYLHDTRECEPIAERVAPCCSSVGTEWRMYIYLHVRLAASLPRGPTEFVFPANRSLRGYLYTRGISLPSLAPVCFFTNIITGFGRRAVLLFQSLYG